LERIWILKSQQKRKNRVSGRAYRTQARVSQCKATRTVHACRTHGRVYLTPHDFPIFSFRRLAHKIPTVNVTPRFPI